MLNKGKFESVLTVTVTLARLGPEVRPRKFVKLSVIVYDALVRYCADIVIGVET